MKIGIIGAGAIGAELARKLSSAGHVVRLANSTSTPRCCVLLSSLCDSKFYHCSMVLNTG
ncbi:NAD(P)-binding domain-containing protein [Dickeya zeae]|uniref:NAD(P)-binding domain-containing protein n=1 Tax=Dickeya zeae TaxID=204042 RepID=UPI0026922653